MTEAVPADHPFGIHNLPYGVFTTPDRPDERRIGVAYGDDVIDLGAAALGAASPYADLLTAATLNPLMAAGRAVWTDVRAAAREWARAGTHRVPRADVTLHLPIEVGDYVDFYASENHATNLGRIFRPGGEPLTPNWKHLPLGYHGRSGTVVVSGTDIARPVGQRRTPAEPEPVFGPSVRLDIEAEVGFVVGMPSPLGSRVPLAAARDHIFGVFLLNDWSARDIQAWEYVPLGPHLGKSFATSVSPWIVPLDALDAARVAPPARDVTPPPYLDDRRGEPWGLDIAIEVYVNGHVVSRPPFATMYWTAAQMLAHMTVNGASLRTGDIFGSGTVSGPEPDTRGALIEITWNGENPLTLPDGSVRTYLQDGDVVTITATAPGPDGGRIGFGEVTGRIVPPRD